MRGLVVLHHALFQLDDLMRFLVDLFFLSILDVDFDQAVVLNDRFLDHLVVSLDLVVDILENLGHFFTVLGVEFHVNLCFLSVFDFGRLLLY